MCDLILNQAVPVPEDDILNAGLYTGGLREPAKRAGAGLRHHLHNCPGWISNDWTIGERLGNCVDKHEQLSHSNETFGLRRTIVYLAVFVSSFA